MSRKKNAEISFEKASVYHAIGVLLCLVFDQNKEVVFESDLETEPSQCKTSESDDETNEEEVDFEDQVMSAVALLCEPFKGRPDLIEECKNYCLMNCDIAIESIMFDDDKKPHLTLVKDCKAD